MVSAPRAAEPTIRPTSAASASRFGRGDLLRLAIAAAAAAAIVAGSPIVNTIRQALLEAWPAGYVPVLVSVVAVTGLALVVFSLRSMGDRSWPRLAALGTAVALADATGTALRTGVANVDAVEAFHFVEYSALTLLLAWALTRPAGAWAWLWAAYAALVVGALDEWTQWFVPGRTGEIRDVAINGIAITCGLLLAWALGLGVGPRRDRRLWPLGIGTAVVVLVIAGFFASAHLGYELRDDETGVFMSYQTREGLAALSSAHAQAWGDGGPAPQGQFAREDQYLSEGLWHVRRRNEAMDDGDLIAAWRENRILEKYFAPLLRITKPDGSPMHALAPEQVAGLAVGRGAASAGRSDANPLAIYTWRRERFWAAVLILAAALVLLTTRVEASLSARRAPEDAHA
jgi:VanZ family protein